MHHGILKYSGFTRLLYGVKLSELMSTHEFEVNEYQLWINYLARLIDHMNNRNSSSFMIKNNEQIIMKL